MLRIELTAVRRMTQEGLLVAVALALHYAEGAIPFLQLLPGGKLGLANVAVLLAFAWFGGRTALKVGLVRCFLTAFIRGSFTMLLYSGAGTVVSVLSMLFCRHFFSRSVSMVGRSMVGAFCFNAAQLAVCAQVLANRYVLAYLPVLTLFAAICGLLTGIVAQKTEKAIYLTENGAAL